MYVDIYYILYVIYYIFNNYTMSSYTTRANGIIVLLYRQSNKHGIFSVVLSSNSVISCSFTSAKCSAILFVLFFTTNRIWSDSLLLEEPIKLHNSSYTVFVYIINIYIYIYISIFLFSIYIYIWFYIFSKGIYIYIFGLVYIYTCVPFGFHINS